MRLAAIAIQNCGLRIMSADLWSFDQLLHFAQLPLELSNKKPDMDAPDNRSV